MWEHSPTRRKKYPLARINRGVNSPINCQRPLSLTEPARGAPHGRPRGRVASLPLGCARAAWPPATHQRHLRHAWAAQALPRGLSATSHPRSVRRATLAAALPRQHLEVIKPPFFAILLIENPNKNQIKFRKIHKTSEIHISQNTTPFSLKFSPLDQKFFPF